MSLLLFEHKFGHRKTNEIYLLSQKTPISKFKIQDLLAKIVVGHLLFMMSVKNVVLQTERNENSENSTVR